MEAAQMTVRNANKKVLHKYVVGLGMLFVHHHTQICCLIIPQRRIVEAPISNLGDEC